MDPKDRATGIAEPVVWRSSRAAKISGGLLALMVAAIADAAVRDTIGGDRGAAVFLVMIPFVFVAVFRLSWWPTLTLTADEVLVRNPVRRYRFPLRSIVAVGPGEWGLVILIGEDEGAAAYLAQKGLASELLGRVTRADRLAVELATAVAAAYERAGAEVPADIDEMMRMDLTPPRRWQALGRARRGTGRAMLLLLAFLFLGLTPFGIAVLLTDGAVAGNQDADIVDVMETVGIAALAIVFSTLWIRAHLRAMRRQTQATEPPEPDPDREGLASF